MEKKKKSIVYSGQPKFFIPINISQLFKPRPPLAEKNCTRRKILVSLPNPNKRSYLCISKIYNNFSKEKNVNLEFEKISFLYKKSSESDFLDSIFFGNRMLQFFSFKKSKIGDSRKFFFISRFLGKFSKKISNREFYSTWQYFVKKKTLLIKIPLMCIIWNSKNKFRVFHKYPC